VEVQSRTGGQSQNPSGGQRLMRVCSSGDVQRNLQAERNARNLTFRNPGPSTIDLFDPERSGREMRKVTRRIYTEKLRRNQQYDDQGLLLQERTDLCDCLDRDCPGCHFPCPKCGSEKCGGECRCGRCFYYAEIEVEGTGQKIKFEPCL